MAFAPVLSSTFVKYMQAGRDACPRGLRIGHWRSTASLFSPASVIFGRTHQTLALSSLRTFWIEPLLQRENPVLANGLAVSGKPCRSWDRRETRALHMGEPPECDPKSRCRHCP